MKNNLLQISSEQAELNVSEQGMSDNEQIIDFLISSELFQYFNPLFNRRMSCEQTCKRYRRVLQFSFGIFDEHLGNIPALNRLNPWVVTDFPQG